MDVFLVARVRLYYTVVEAGRAQSSRLLVGGGLNLRLIEVAVGTQ